MIQYTASEVLSWHSVLQATKATNVNLRQKINLETVAHFSAAKNVVQKLHISHAIHHTYTTKTPRLEHAFPQKPL